MIMSLGKVLSFYSFQNRPSEEILKLAKNESQKRFLTKIYATHQVWCDYDEVIHTSANRNGTVKSYDKDFEPFPKWHRDKDYVTLMHEFEPRLIRMHEIFEHCNHTSVKEQKPNVIDYLKESVGLKINMLALWEFHLSVELDKNFFCYERLTRGRKKVGSRKIGRAHV